MSDFLSFEITEPVDFLMGCLVTSFGLLVIFVIYYLVRVCKRSKGRQPKAQKGNTEQRYRPEDMMRNRKYAQTETVPFLDGTLGQQENINKSVKKERTNKGDPSEEAVQAEVPLEEGQEAIDEVEKQPSVPELGQLSACFNSTTLSPFNNAILQKFNMHPPAYFSSEGMQGGVGGYIIPRQMCGYAPIHAQVPTERAVPASSLLRPWL